ncbi:Golgi-associated plant pathogenesis-related protein 1-like [Mercenaria mercenaria]|uniref:Golgi-associated plant pathogenesis-related protein 1-like n=1 Tax=Mercenaria mercenaria TaxID=6596 RepID=UPI001E1DEEA0|nr:Golgi-associated plant pathogenesis-related protein 1-like [Mercenaria mercenaria]
MALRQLIFLCLLATVLCVKVKLNKKFINQALKRHNEIRALHGVDPVVISNRLSKYAQKRANKLAKRRDLVHRPNIKYGENLSFVSGSASGMDHVDNLYTEEEQHYSDNNYYGREPPQSDFLNYGHFTQIVWKGSRKIGVGKAGGYVVISYEPAGNFLGQFRENVYKKV